MNDKIILFSDTQLPVAINGFSIVWYNTKNKTISDLLSTIEEVNPKAITIYAELILNDAKRSIYQGVELAKHIRLTPLKADLQNLPIVFLHWLPIEHYIEKNLENLFLFSSGIKRQRLPLGLDAIQIPEPLKENITPFLLLTQDNDRISEHTFRNEIAITQFEADVKSGNNDFKSKPIWYKKLFHKQGYTIETTAESQTQIQQCLKILLIDDMGDKWKPALLKVLPNSEIEVCKTVSDAQEKIKELDGSIISRRNTFNQKVNTLLDNFKEIEEIKVNIKSTLTFLQNYKKTLDTSKKVLSEEKKIIVVKNNELISLLKELTKNDGLLEALIDFKTANLNSESKLKAKKLSDLITDISNAKEKVSDANKAITDKESKISESELNKNKLDSELKTLVANQRNFTKEASDLFESLFVSEYDLVLLDMHLTEDSEGKDVNEMDGFQVLEAINNYNLKIPTAIFSATTKQVDQLNDKFKFLQRKKFLKGITPPKNLSLIIEDLNTNSVVNRLINTIDEVIAYPQLKYREYEECNSNNYNTNIISNINRNNIKDKLNTVKILLNSYTADKNLDYLKNIVSDLGDILREHRFTVKSSALNRQNSLFYIENTKKNGISHQCTHLIYRRNKIVHYPNLTFQEKKECDKWCNNLDLIQIENHLRTVYRGLVFDE